MMLRDERGITIEMPDVTDCEDLLDWLSQLGYANRGMGGLEPLTYVDVQTWDEVNESDLASWMKVLLVTMSREYCHQASISSDPKCNAPYVMVISEDDRAIMRERTGNKLRNLFGNG